MKLWMKQTILILFVVSFFLGACSLFTIVYQTDNMMDEALKSCEANLNTISMHMNASGVSNDNQRYESDITKRSVMSYSFSQYAGILQSDTSKYALLVEGQYTFHVSSIRFDELLPQSETLQAEYRLFSIDGAYTYLGYRNMTVLGMPVTIYHALTIDETIQRINLLQLVAQIVLVACVGLLAVILPIVIRFCLRPLGNLTAMAQAMSDGAYNLRTGYQTEDEVGRLSATFDKMADTIQETFRSLEDTANRRELLLAALTHELKTPMTAIIGYADGFLSLPLDEEKKNTAIKAIFDSAKRVENLSQKMMQLISYTENAQIEKRLISVNWLLEEVRDETMMHWKTRNISLEISASVDNMLADRDLLFCLLTNLIDNACKASNNNSTIQISVQRENEHVSISVADEGCGIPAEQIPFVFEPFYRVDKSRSRKIGGVGLGLSLCQMIVKAHNGNIEIDSSIDIGTTIKVYIPEGDYNDK